MSVYLKMNFLNSSTEYNDVVRQLQDYMLTNDRIAEIVKSTEDKQAKKSEDKPKTNTTFFIPKQKDSLLWCYYIIVNGDMAYELLNKNFIVEKQIKIDLVYLIRKNKDILKTYKYDTIVNIESNLANDNLMNIKTFLSLCVISNLNIIYISKKTYFESFTNDTDNVFVVSEISTTKGEKTQHKIYGFKMVDKTEGDKIKSTLYQLEKIDKPIKSMASYKVDDLTIMCEKLAIETVNNTGKKKTKKDLYESIIQYF